VGVLFVVGGGGGCWGLGVGGLVCFFVFCVLGLWLGWCVFGGLFFVVWSFFFFFLVSKEPIRFFIPSEEKETPSSRIPLRLISALSRAPRSAEVLDFGEA